LGTPREFQRVIAHAVARFLFAKNGVNQGWNAMDFDLLGV